MIFRSAPPAPVRALADTERASAGSDTTPREESRRARRGRGDRSHGEGIAPPRGPISPRGIARRRVHGARARVLRDRRGVGGRRRRRDRFRRPRRRFVPNLRGRPAVAVRNGGGDHRQGQRKGEEEGRTRLLPPRRRPGAGRHEVRLPQRAAHEPPAPLRLRLRARVAAQRPGGAQTPDARAQAQGGGSRPEILLEKGRGARAGGPRRRGSLRLRQGRRGRRPGRDRRPGGQGGGDAVQRRGGRDLPTAQRAPPKALARAERRGQDARAARGGAREERVGVRAKEGGEAASRGGRSRLSRRVVGRPIAGRHVRLRSHVGSQ